MVKIQLSKWIYGKLLAQGLAHKKWSVTVSYYCDKDGMGFKEWEDAFLPLRYLSYIQESKPAS